MKIICTLIIIFIQVISIFAKQQPKIAIIGSGIGGSSFSHYLHKQFKNIDVTLFEKNDRIGGRTNSIQIAGKTKELGAHFIIDSNLNMKSLVQELNLNFVQEQKRPFSIIKDGEPKFISSQYSIVTIFKMIWRYGYNLFVFMYTQAQFMKKFMNIYDFQDNQEGVFETYEEYMQITTGQSDYLSKTAQQVFIEELNSSQLFAEEVLDSIISNFYNQNYNTNGYTGHISAAGLQGNPKLLKEGLSTISQTILSQQSEQKLTNVINNTQVLEITILDNGQKQLHLQNLETNELYKQNYDTVVIATPIEMTNIKLDNKINFQIENRKSIKIVKYIVASKSISHQPFGFNSQEEMTEIIMSPDRIFGKISVLEKMCNKCQKLKSSEDLVNIYNWTGKQELTDSELEQLFPEGYEIILKHENNWPYPDLSSTKNQKSSPIILFDGLYYLNGMEFIASCMEMETISAKNIVNLIKNKEGQNWDKQKIKKIDEL